MMAHHEVRSWPEFFQPIRDGKPFDVRQTDRHYRIGDTITFNEFDDMAGKPTGQKEKRTITHVFAGGGAGAMPPLRGLARGYAVLGFLPTDVAMLLASNAAMTRTLREIKDSGQEWGADACCAHAFLGLGHAIEAMQSVERSQTKS